MLLSRIVDRPVRPLLERLTRVLFFTGKGGVGKTSVACATALALADAGKRVLLVSTDPASNLDEVLGVSLTGAPTSVPEAPGLFALNIDPLQAAAAYREAMIAPVRGKLPVPMIRKMEEQLSGGCTVEIAAFDAFARLAGDPRATEGFDHLLFDTAPTGHTLRLLSLPAAWTGFFETNATGATCLGPLEGLSRQQELYADTVKLLTDPKRTTLVLVARPEVAAIKEAERTRGELAALGFANQRLVINGIFHAADPADPIAGALQARGAAALASIADALGALPRTELPLRAASPMGLDGLRAFFSAVEATGAAYSGDCYHPPAKAIAFEALVDDVERQGRGGVMAMGKGGVGKTTVAVRVAVALARRGHKVRLTTTDPAAHLALTIGEKIPPNLILTRIDPAAEVSRYAAHVMETAGTALDAAGRAMLEEDLRSPCTEEIAVFQAFAKTVAAGEDGFVVIDTAPTGHTILLLDAAEAYHREVLRNSQGVATEVVGLLARLRDPGFTKILLVALPEATPVHEAAALQEDLARADIHPFAWVLNQCLSPLTVTDPLLAHRRHQEGRFIAEVADRRAERLIIQPWTADPLESR